MTESSGFRGRPVRGVLAAFVVASALGLAACKDDVELAAEHFQAAVELREAGNVEKALVEFRNALKLNPKNPETSWLIGRIEMERGEVQTAFRYYLRAADPTLGHMDAQVEVIKILLAAGQLDDALARANIALGLQPNHADALGLRAAVLQMRGQDAAAVADAQAVLRLEPTHGGATAVLATDAIRRREFGQAERLLTEAIDPAAPDPGLVRLLGLALAAQDKIDGAIDQFRILVDLEPAIVDHRRILARLLVQAERPDEAMAVLVQGIEAAGAETEPASLALVEFLAENQGVDKAAAKLQELIAQNPDGGIFDMALAALHARSGDVVKATTVLTAATERLGDSEAGLRVLAGLAQYWAAIGEGAKAQATVERVLAVDAAHVGALMVRAALFSNGGRTEDALRDVNTILGSDPRNAVALRMLAELKGRGDRLTEAAEALERLVEVQPQDEEARLQLAAVLEAAGERQRADDVLSEQLRRSPTSVEAWKTMARTALSREDWDGAQRAVARIAAIPGAEREHQRLVAELAAARSTYPEAADGFRRLVEESAETALDRDALVAFTRASLLGNLLDPAVDFLQAVADRAEGPDAYLTYTLLARVHEQKQATDKTMAALRSAIEAYPVEAGAYVALARTLVTLGDLATAGDTLERGLQAGADRAELMVARGMVQELLGTPAAAIDSYREALTINPTSLLAANNLGSLVADQYPNEQDILKDALLRVESFAGTEDAMLLDTVAWLNYRLGNLEAARVLLERAGAGTHENPQLRYHYGAVLLALQEVQQGRAVLSSTVGYDFPGSEDVARLLVATK